MQLTAEGSVCTDGKLPWLQCSMPQLCFKFVNVLQMSPCLLAYLPYCLCTIAFSIVLTTHKQYTSQLGHPELSHNKRRHHLTRHKALEVLLSTCMSNNHTQYNQNMSQQLNVILT